MEQFTRSHAILIGINHYSRGIHPLTTAVNDATQLGERLQTEHGYTTQVLTGDVTLHNLRHLFRDELPERVAKNDRLLVYFAGHGIAETVAEGDGPQGFLLPQDARAGDTSTFLSMTELHDWLNVLPCRHLMVILDCCFSGAFRWASTRTALVIPPVIHKERYDRYLTSPAWQVLTSAGYDQMALDILPGKSLGVREIDSAANSPFAQALLNALDGDADLIPKDGGDGVITATELYLYLREQVEVQASVQANHEQTPGLWPLNKHRQGEYIFLSPSWGELQLPQAPVLNQQNNPYRGLNPYEQTHSSLFFGRDAEIVALTGLVESHSLVAVLGASGTGKSSLVKAGLLPALEDQKVGWRILPPMRPGQEPQQALNILLGRELGFNLNESDGDDALAKLIGVWGERNPGQRLVLTIDQLEELVILCSDNERDLFLRLLTQAVIAQAASLRLVFTLRTDFEPHFNRDDSPLNVLWMTARYFVPPLDINDLRQVIEQPASERSLFFEPPELVDNLIAEVLQTPGALPLLSFTLSELYMKSMQSGRNDRALTAEDYHLLGGVIGSLGQRADEEYDALPDDDHRQTMQRVMLRMIASDGSELSRRRVLLSELTFPTQAGNNRVQTVLERMVNTRLLVRGSMDSQNSPNEDIEDIYVEPAHDTLILSWGRLLRWRKDAEYLLLQHRLTIAATEWDQAAPHLKQDLLWNDNTRLSQLEETLWPTNSKPQGNRLGYMWRALWPTTHLPSDTKWLNRAEVAFLQESMIARARFWRRTVSVTTTVLIILSLTTIFALMQWNRAQSESDARASEIVIRRTAESNAIVAQGTAVAEADARATEVVLRSTAQIEAEQERLSAEARKVEAEQQTRLAQARQMSLQAPIAFEEDQELGLLLAMAAISETLEVDGFVVPEADRALRTLVDASYLRKSQLFNPNDPTDTPRSFVVSDNGWFLLILNSDNVPQLRDTSSLKILHYLPPISGSTWSSCMSISPSNRYIAVIDGQNGGGYIWGLDEKKVLNTLTFPLTSGSCQIDLIDTMGVVSFPGASYSFVFSYLNDEKPPVRLAYPLVRFIPNTQMLLAVTKLREVVVLDIGKTRTLGEEEYDYYFGKHFLPGIDFTDNLIRFSNDGHYVAFRTSQNSLSVESIIVLQLEDGSFDFSLEPVSHNSEVFGEFNPDKPVEIQSIEFVSDTNTLVACDNLQRCRVLDIGSGQVRLEFASRSGSIQVSPRTNRTLIGGQLFDLNTWSLIFSLPVGPDLVFIQDGTHILSVDQKLQVWAVNEYSVAPQLRGHTQVISAVTVSQDGKRIATASYDGTVRIWDTSSGSSIKVLFQGPPIRPGRGFDGFVRGLAFDHKANFLAVGSKNPILWEVDSGLQIDTIECVGPITKTEFSSDGELLLIVSSGGFDYGTICLYDMLGRTVLWETRASGGSYSVHALNFAFFEPLGRYILADMENPKLFDAQTGEVIQEVDIGGSDQVWDAKFNSDGSLVALGLRDRIEVWDVLNRKIRWSVEWVGNPYKIALSKDNRYIAANRFVRGDWIGIWNVETGLLEQELHGHNDEIRDLEFSPDSKTLVTVDGEGEIRIWDVLTGLLQAATVSSGLAIIDIAFGPDSTWFVVGEDDFSARIHRTTQGLMQIAASWTNRELSTEERLRYLGGPGD